jgi:asparagine synthase (glutamine-hydrolysing)
MTGIVGGSVTGRDLGAMANALHAEPWYGEERFEQGDYGLGIRHHDERDPAGWTAWQGDGSAGMLHGAITNREQRGLTDAVLFESVLDEPLETLPGLDGSFALACTDGERLVLATDKLGTRPCYHHADDRLLFASGLPPVLAELDDPGIDEQGAGDMLLLGHLWGEKTLIEGIRALPPATVLEYAGGDASTERYWWPEFEPAPVAGYLDSLIGRYRTAMADASRTVAGEAGLWLSGGLDSRAMAGELKRNVETGVLSGLSAYTYDSNPRGAGNPELARRIAARLDVPIEEVRLTPERFLERVEPAIDLTDGMLRWSSMANLMATFALPDERPDVLLEGAGQGELVGEHLTRGHLRCSPAESMYRSEAMVDAADAAALLAADVDPRDSLRAVAARSDERTRRGRIFDAHFGNYYSRMVFASDAVTRSQVGTRVPFAHGDFLAHAARLPPRYQLRTLPGTEIPYSVTQPKLELVRALGPALAGVPYERTGLAPSWSFGLHVAGFVAKTGLSRLRSRTTYGGRSTLDEWYREHEGMRAFVDGLLDDARDRGLFDGDAVEELRREHLAGEANHVVTGIAAVTTLEYWLQSHFD